MLKLCATILAVGMTIGTAASVKGIIDDLQHQLADTAVTMATLVPVIRPIKAHAVLSDPSEGDRLVEVARDLNISREHLHAVAQDAASDCNGSTCMEVMVAVWGSAWTERLLHETDLGTNGQVRPAGIPISRR